MKKTFVSIQTRSILGQSESNLKRAAQITENCSIPFDFILFPELFGTGYTWGESSKQLIVESQNTIEQWLKILSQKYHCVVLAGIGRYDNGLFYNSTVIYDHGRFVDYYDKSHLFRGENNIFQSGGEFKTFQLSDVN